jgi:hypothetical protein
MAHLTCVRHGIRSVVMGDNPNKLIVRHLTNGHGKGIECDSKIMEYGGRVIEDWEVFESRYEHGIKQYIFDRDNHAEVSRIIVALSDKSVPDAIIGADIENLKAKLNDRWQNRSLKRVGRRGK